MKALKLTNCIAGILALFCVHSALAKPKLVQTGTCSLKNGPVVFSWALSHDNETNKTSLLASNKNSDFADLSQFEKIMSHRADKSSKKLVFARFPGSIGNMTGPWLLDIDATKEEAAKQNQTWILTKQGGSNKQIIYCSTNDLAGTQITAANTPNELDSVHVQFMPINDAAMKVSFRMWVTYEQKEGDLKDNIKTFFGGKIESIRLRQKSNGRMIATEIVGSNQYGKWSFFKQWDGKQWFWVINGKVQKSGSQTPEELTNVMAKSGEDNNPITCPIMHENTFIPVVDAGICSYDKQQWLNSNSHSVIFRWRDYANGKVLWSRNSDPKKDFIDNGAQVTRDSNKRLTSVKVYLDKGLRAYWHMSFIKDIQPNDDIHGQDVLQEWSLLYFKGGLDEGIPNKETIYCRVVNFARSTSWESERDIFEEDPDLKAQCPVSTTTEQPVTASCKDEIKVPPAGKNITVTCSPKFETQGNITLPVIKWSYTSGLSTEEIKKTVTISFGDIQVSNDELKTINIHKNFGLPVIINGSTLQKNQFTLMSRAEDCNNPNKSDWNLTFFWSSEPGGIPIRLKNVAYGNCTVTEN